MFPAKEAIGLAVTTSIPPSFPLHNWATDISKEAFLYSKQELTPLFFRVTLGMLIFYDLFSETPNSRVLILPLISLRFSAGFHPPSFQLPLLPSHAILIVLCPHRHCPIKIHIIPRNVIKIITTPRISEHLLCARCFEKYFVFIIPSFFPETQYIR